MAANSTAAIEMHREHAVSQSDPACEGDILSCFVDWYTLDTAFQVGIAAVALVLVGTCLLRAVTLPPRRVADRRTARAAKGDAGEANEADEALFTSGDEEQEVQPGLVSAAGAELLRRLQDLPSNTDKEDEECEKMFDARRLATALGFIYDGAFLKLAHRAELKLVVRPGDKAYVGLKRRGAPADTGLRQRRGLLAAKHALAE